MDLKLKIPLACAAGAFLALKYAGKESAEDPRVEFEKTEKGDYLRVDKKRYDPESSFDMMWLTTKLVVNKVEKLLDLQPEIRKAAGALMAATFMMGGILYLCENLNKQQWPIRN